MEHRLSVIVSLIIFFSIDLILMVHAFRNRANSKNEKVFFAFALFTTMQQFFTILVNLVYPGILEVPDVIHYIFLIGMFLSMTCCSAVWYFYLRRILFEDKKPNIWQIIVFYLPFFAMVIACFISPFTHWFYYIQNGSYVRGNLAFLLVAIPNIYILFGVILSICVFRLKQHEINKRFIKYFAVFVIPFAACTLIQVFVIQGGYSAIGNSISLILMYLDFYIEERNENIRFNDIRTLNEKLVFESEKGSNLLALVHAISSHYFCIYWIDLRTGMMKTVRALPQMIEKLGKDGKTEDVINGIIDNFIIDEDKERIRDFCNTKNWPNMLRNEDSVSIEYKGISSEDSRLTLFVIKRDSNGEATQVAATTRTIHEEIAIRDNLKKSRDEANAANDAKTSFLFNMSHDIRTPMNAIIGFRDLLEKNIDDKAKREDYLRKIDKSSKVLLSIINNVLEMARIEKGRIEIEEVAWSSEQFNDSLSSMFKALMEQKNIIYSSEVNIEHKYVYCDPSKLREIFINILSNAYKYTESGGSVKMVLEEIPCDKPGYVNYKTTISDTGIGMSEEFIPRIFEEFSREQSSTESKIEGTGLGMPIVKKLISLMNGSISITSKKGVGTSVSIIIPHKIANKEDLLNTHNSTGNAESFKGKRVILCEDNDLNAEIAMEILSEQGFILERAVDGLDCIELLKSKEPDYFDLILMDIQMPRMNGYEATKEIRKLGDERSSIPIVAMTANAFEEDKREAMKSGMNGHIAKPVDINELIEVLKTVLMKE